MILLSIILGTLIREDGIGILVGLMLREGRLSWPVALGGCYVGILLGDFGL